MIDQRRLSRIGGEGFMTEGHMLGFIGVGRMGAPMSGRLIDAGYSLCVYDANPEATKPLVARGAKLAKS